MNAENVTLIGARCLVKEIREKTTTESGILVPGADKEQTNIGIVLAVGGGAILENGTVVPMQVKVGDKVIYSSFSGSPIKEKKDDPDNYLILNERDILCIMQEG